MAMTTVYPWETEAGTSQVRDRCEGRSLRSTSHRQKLKQNKTAGGADSQEPDPAQVVL